MVDMLDVDLGRGSIYNDLRFVGEVAAGGAVGPGKIYRYTDYNRSVPVYFTDDCRSGSKRSGSCTWQLDKDTLYRLEDIAISSSRNGRFFVSTYDNDVVAMSREEFDNERRRIFPLGFQIFEEEKLKSERLEADRIARQTAEAEQRRIAREALAELNAERAKEIEVNGQPDEGLPVLSGTPKQIAYALSIRAAFALRHPKDASLKRGTTAKYWIENHRKVLFA